MSCNCNNNCHEKFCPQYLETVIPPCDELGCEQQLTTDCVIYTGPDIPCLNFVTGMSLTEILLNILYELHPECVGTSTTTIAPEEILLQEDGDAILQEDLFNILL